MVFKYQIDSFLKKFTSTVVSCTEARLITSIDGKEQALNCHESGRYNNISRRRRTNDHGVINKSNVLWIKRVNGKAVHFVDKPLAIGEEVKQKVEWKRRFDHMQQHSGKFAVV